MFQTTNQFVISPTNHFHEHLSLQMCLENIWGVTVSKDFQDLVPIKKKMLHQVSGSTTLRLCQQFAME